MVFLRPKLDVVLLGVLCMTIPSVSVWAAGTTVADTSGFGAAGLSTSNSNVPSANGCINSSVACSTNIYTVDISSKDFLNVSTFTYVYTIKVETANTYSCTGSGTCTTLGGTLTSPPSNFTLSSITIGSPNFDLVNIGGNTGYGMVTAGTSGASFSSAILNSSSLQFLPTSLGVGNTLQVYAQSNQSPFFTSGSTQDGGNVASGPVVAPTPEPASIALFGSGLVLLGGVLRRRLHRKAT